jgi:hypothetical protein
MVLIPMLLLMWCVAFVIAGWNIDGGVAWANSLCTEADFLCAQPYWLVAAAAVTAVPAIYRDLGN